MRSAIRLPLVVMMFLTTFLSVRCGVRLSGFGNRHPARYTIFEKHSNGSNYHEFAVVPVFDDEKLPRTLRSFSIPKSLYDAAEIGSTLVVNHNYLTIIRKDNSRVTAIRRREFLSDLLRLTLFCGFWSAPLIIWILNRDIINSKIFVVYASAIVSLFFFLIFCNYCVNTIFHF
jgi:hypothetical protein